MKLILFLIVTVSSYVLVQALDTVCLFFIIYITLLEYLLTKFLDEIKVWCHRPVAFKGSWLLNMPDCIIIFFLLEFRFVCLHLISNAHMADLAPCLCIYFDIPVLKEGYEALRINSTTNIFISVLSNCFKNVAMWYGDIASSISSMNWPNFSVSFMKEGAVM